MHFSRTLLQSKVNPFYEFITQKHQKKSPRGVLVKKCFKIMPQIYRRTPMAKRGFNEDATPLRDCFWNSYLECTLLSESCHIFFLV